MASVTAAIDIHAIFRVAVIAAYLLVAVLLLIRFWRLAKTIQRNQAPLRETARRRLLITSGLWIFVSLSFPTILRSI